MTILGFIALFTTMNFQTKDQNTDDTKTTEGCTSVILILQYIVSLFTTLITMKRNFYRQNSTVFQSVLILINCLSMLFGFLSLFYQHCYQTNPYFWGHVIFSICLVFKNISFIITLCYFFIRSQYQQVEENLVNNLEEIIVQQYPQPIGLSQIQIEEKTKRYFLNDTKSEACTICLDQCQKFEEVREMFPCQHFFHVKCIDNWLTRSATCPNCRLHI